MSTPSPDLNAYVIVCRVSGGVTGTREALLKQGENRQVRYFASRQEAEQVAADLMVKANKVPKPLGGWDLRPEYSYRAVPASQAR